MKPPRIRPAPRPTGLQVSLAAMALVASLACFDLPSTQPPFAEHFEPPPIYAAWWRQVETCSGLRGNLEDVTFFRVRHEAEFEFNGMAVSGLYQLGAHRITVAGLYEHDGQLVRHEMLHALTRKIGHQREYFKARCGFVVSCEGVCSREAGPLPPAPAIAVEATPSLLVLSAGVAEGTPSRSRFGNIVPITVTLRNPTGGHVYVVPRGVHAMLASRLSGPGLWEDDDLLWYSTTLHFAPYESKTAAFDLRVGIIGTPVTPPLEPADTIDHEVRFAFGDHWSPAFRFRTVK